MNVFLYVFFTLHVIISCTLIVNYEAEITNSIAPSETPDIDNLSSATQSNLLENEPTPLPRSTIEPSVTDLNLEISKKQIEKLNSSSGSTANR
ncbi:unnamed protein product [Callosobruchus maculatus]|uniref:Uncharacterized protein n=1 Tax=Callosobruchus maculatus TaxID=64391 RepID=A0A653CIZ3_CALMS|nr:unnamed protein product [Callosobruchus maculatus]